MAETTADGPERSMKAKKMRDVQEDVGYHDDLTRNAATVSR